MSKGPEAFRTISEAADEVGVAQHVLRFWETRFSFVRPVKTAGGRRFYRPADIAMLSEVRRLLHHEGYSIKALQKLHREQGIRSISPVREFSPPGRSSSALLRALRELEAAKSHLDGLLSRSPT